MHTEIHPEDWTFEGETGTVYPFIEDEYANVTGYGHQDPREFAEALVNWDLECGAIEEDDAEGTLDAYADAIGHRWAVMDPDDDERFWVNIPESDERMKHLFAPGPVTESTPGAFQITTLWNWR